MAFVAATNADIQAVKQGKIPARYKSLVSFINEVNQPQHLEEIAETYGNQQVGGPFGLIQLMGVPSDAGQADEINYWEKARLHAVPNGTIASTSPGDKGTKTITTQNDHNVIDNDVLLLNGRIRVFAKSQTAKTYTVQPLSNKGFGVSFSANEFVKVQKIGNLQPQGGDAPTESELSNIVKYTQGFSIMTDSFSVTGSQMGNKSWFKDSETGMMYFDIVGKNDFYKRYENKLEAMSMFGATVDNTSITDDVAGFDGYFTTIEDRGFVWPGYIQSLSEIDYINNVLDKNGGATEYAWFQNTTGCANFDDMVAESAGNIGTPTYGAFANSGVSDPKGMALKLGFGSFNRGGRTFHNKKLAMLQDPTFGGQTEFYKGVMTPMDQVTDPKTDIQVPSLQMFVKNYHGAGSRWKESFIPQSGVNGDYKDGGDRQTYSIRSEWSILTRAAQRHLIQRGK